MNTWARLSLFSGLALSASLAKAQDVPAPEPTAAGIDAAADSTPAPANDQKALDVIPVESAKPEDHAPEAARTSNSRLVEEVVVTAQKREENLQQVPISIQAFSAGMLDAQGVLSVQNLPQITPGLTVTTQVGYTSTYIRGVGSDAFLLGDPSVASYYDGIYQPFPNGLVQDFGAIERIEVLKGPQGTLFGRNAVGGAINVITRKPNLEKVDLIVQTAYESYATSKTRAYISVPIGDTFAASISAVYNTGDNPISGVTDGKPLPNQVSKGGRLQLRWAPADWLDAQLTAYKVNNTGPGTSYTPNVSPSLVLGAAIQPQNPYAGSENEDLYYRHDDTSFYGQVALNLDWLDIKLLGSHQKVNSSFNYDFDSSPTPLALFQIDNVFANVTTAELQLLSNKNSWGADWFRWIVGGYYFKSKTGFDPAFLRVASTNLQDGLLFGVQVPSTVTDLVNTITGGAPIPTGDINFIGLLGTQSLASFAQATFDLTDWAALTLGGRLQREKRTLINSTSSLRNADGSETLIQSYKAGQTPIVLGGVPAPDSGPDLVSVTQSFDPKIAIDFKPDWSWLGYEPLIYASWQTATKSSTYNTVNIYDPPDYVKPEDMVAYEVGFKTTLLDHTMRFSAAAFDYRIRNQQVQFISLLAGGAVTFENAGSVSVRGFEFDTLTQLFPDSIDDLVLTLGAAFLNPKYSSYPDGSGFNQAGLLTQHNDYTGNQVVRSAKQSGTVGLSKTTATSYGPLEIGASYAYNSGFFYSAQNSDVAKENPYGLLSAHISLLYAPWNLRMTTYGENLTNARHSYGKFPSDFGVGDARAPLATYGLRLQYEF